MAEVRNMMSGKGWRVGGVVVAAALGVVLLLAAPSDKASAELSCDNPPPPFDAPDVLANVQRVWDLTDFCQRVIDYDEIIGTSVPRDGIPPIDNPEFESIETASAWLQDQSPVIAVNYDGEARAYPLAILTRHEIVNDVFDDIPVAVTFCPLCNSAIVFDRRVDGQTLRFGVSGLLRNSDLIMWDDVTQSWWQQFTGEGIVGEYAGVQLAVLPSQVVGFGQFAEQFPDGKVLARGARSYGSNPYVGYDSDETPFLFAGAPDDRLFPVERVLAGIIDGQPIAYPFSALTVEKVVNDTVGAETVVVFHQDGQASALDKSTIDESRDVGTAAMYRRVLDDGQVLTFSVDEAGVIRDDQTGSAWNVFGVAVAGELEGTKLQPMLAAPHFWFAWAAFYPETAVYGMELANQSQEES